MSVFQDFKRETKVFGNRTVIVQVQRFSFSRKVIKQPVFLCLLYPLFHEPVQIFHKLILLNPSPFSVPPIDIEESESLSAEHCTMAIFERNVHCSLFNVQLSFWGTSRTVGSMRIAN